MSESSSRAAAEQLGKAGNFLGQHLLTPRLGVAVQINAFNFPVWGPLEKLAPALIAGVPSLIKPASQTGYLTVRLVELIIESGLLPAGALQLISGSAGDLLGHLQEQDLLSFTGSASTAQRLRSHPNVVARSVRFNAEADSLNMSVLGPDATPGTPAFDRYVRQLVTEMTVKAGQKCTAIRRAFVPAGQLDAVTEAVRERLAGWWSATPPMSPCGWARWPASSSAKRSAARSRPWRQPGGSSSATPSTSRSPGRTPPAGPSCHRCSSGPRTRAGPSCTRSRRSARSPP